MREDTLSSVAVDLNLILKGMGLLHDKKIDVEVRTQVTYKGKSLVIEDYLEKETSSFREWEILTNTDRLKLLQGDYTNSDLLRIAEDTYKLIKKKDN